MGISHRIYVSLQLGIYDSCYIVYQEIVLHAYRIDMEGNNYLRKKSLKKLSSASK